LDIDITALLEHPEETQRVQGSKDPSEFPLESESFQLEHSLEVDFTILNEAEVIVARGRYDGILTSVCGRCLDSYEGPLDGELEARFFPTREQLIAEKQQEEDAVYREPIDQGRIHLGFVVAQDILVQCPMRPLCDPDCEGLCPECGANRNHTDCGHEGEKLDPRLSKFRELADELEENN